MTTSSPAPGGSYTYTGDQIGERAATALMPGTVVTVREVVAAGTTGAHNQDEDSVVIEWTATGQTVVSTRTETQSFPQIVLGENGYPVLDEDGKPKVALASREVPVYEYGDGQVLRAMSVGAAMFATNFQEA